MVATGVRWWRRLEAPGVEQLQGAGIYYGGGATRPLSCRGRDRLRSGRGEFWQDRRR